MKKTHKPSDNEFELGNSNYSSVQSDERLKYLEKQIEIITLLKTEYDEKQGIKKAKKELYNNIFNFFTIIISILALIVSIFKK